MELATFRIVHVSFLPVLKSERYIIYTTISYMTTIIQLLRIIPYYDAVRAWQTELNYNFYSTPLTSSCLESSNSNHDDGEYWRYGVKVTEH